jgi:hypothetical protein
MFLQIAKRHVLADSSGINVLQALPSTLDLPSSAINPSCMGNRLDQLYETVKDLPVILLPQPLPPSLTEFRMPPIPAPQHFPSVEILDKHSQKTATTASHRQASSPFKPSLLSLKYTLTQPTDLPTTPVIVKKQPVPSVSSQKVKLSTNLASPTTPRPPKRPLSPMPNVTKSSKPRINVVQTDNCYPVVTTQNQG